MKTIKFIKVSLIVLLVAGAFAACKKDKKPVVNGSIYGKWAGKIGPNVSDLKDFSFTVKPEENGKAVLEEVTDSGNPGKVLEGTWKLTDTGFSADLPYDGGNYSLLAAFDIKEEKLTLGTLTDSADPSLTKIFYLNKVK